MVHWLVQIPNSKKSPRFNSQIGHGVCMHFRVRMHVRIIDKSKIDPRSSVGFGSLSYFQL